MDKRVKRKNIEGIADNKRDAIRAFLKSGKTYREIAVILGVSKSTVGNVAKEPQAADAGLVDAICVFRHSVSSQNGISVSTHFGQSVSSQNGQSVSTSSVI